MIFVDSSYVIALVRAKDRWHENAEKIADFVYNNNKAISIPIIVEIINIVGSKQGADTGKYIYDYIKDNYTIYHEKDILDKSMKEFLKYNGKLSLADCTAIVTMQELNIKKIVSFDSDFDKVNGIERIK